MADRIHDRRSIDAPRAAVTVASVVECPAEPQARLLVSLNVRGDPLALLRHRKLLDASQFAAGRRWQQYREDAEIGGARAIDPTREAVDGGRFKEPDVSRLSKALAQLHRAHRALPIDDVPLLFDVLARGMSLTTAGTVRGLASGRQIVALTDRFRKALNTLARLWGLA